MHSNRKSLIGCGLSSNINKNRVELNFHKNPLNNRLGRTTSTRSNDVKPIKFGSVSHGSSSFRSPLRSTVAAVAVGATSPTSISESKVFLEPINPFSPIKSPIRLLGSRSCVSEIVPTRRFEPEKLPEITPNSFLGDIPRVNLSRDNRVRKPMFGQRTSLRTINSKASSLYRTNGQSFKFVPMPMSFNFSALNVNDALSSPATDSFRSSLTPQTTAGERPLSRTSDVSNISVNSAISSRLIQAEDEQNEKKRRLLQAIRQKDRRRRESDVQETVSMCTNLGRLADDLNQSHEPIGSYLKRKRTLESSREGDHLNQCMDCDEVVTTEEDNERSEMNAIFINGAKRRSVASRTQFKNNEILSSLVHTSTTAPTGHSLFDDKIMCESARFDSPELFKIPTTAVKLPTITPNKRYHAPLSASLRSTQSDRSSQSTEEIDETSVNRNQSNGIDRATSDSSGGIFAALASSFNLFRKK